MPGSGYNSESTKTARRMLEFCRYAYKAYAQTCEYPLDPFFEAHGVGGDSARTRLLTSVHERLGTQRDATKFDPVPYRLTTTPNPHEGVVYRGKVANEPQQYILFQPRPLDLSVKHVRGFGIDGNPVDPGNTLLGATGGVRCGYFQGRTGMTQTHPTAGWQSWLGAVLFDPATSECVIVFRGSRSGAGARAFTQAQFSSKGSPDWVTDMNMLKPATVQRLSRGKISAGFHYAFESCRTSLLAAYNYATKGGSPNVIRITGHSLGGALATCAYLDLTCGELATHIVMPNPTLRQTFAIECYPLSAPPVVLGRRTHQALSFACDATKIRHYFCPTDVVHTSPLVESSGKKVGFAVIKAFTHPMTDPFHVGSEVVLPSRAAFPDSHEPEEVYKGLHGGASDPEFWLSFDFDPVASGHPIKGVPTNLKDACKRALAASIDATRARARATDWQEVAKSQTRSQGIDEGGKKLDLAMELGLQIRQTADPTTIHASQIALNKHRTELLEAFAGARGHRASSAAIWSMLQLVAVDQYLMS